MKKLLFITFLAVCMLALSAIFVNADESNVCKVTFWMPYGHHYVIDKGETYPEPQRYETTDSLVLEVEKGHVLTEEDVEPFTHHCTAYNHIHDYCKVSMTGWDVDPVGMEITEDTAFTAVMNKDTCKVTVRMDKGYYIGYDTYESFDIEVDRGYTVTEDDAEKFSTADYSLGVPNNPHYEITGVEPDPTGYVVNEDVEFTATAKHFVYLQFMIPNLKGEWTMLYGKDFGIREDEELKRDDLPEIDSYYFNEIENSYRNTVLNSYWDIKDEELSKLPLSEEDAVALYAYVSVKGDCNYDMNINTADAVCVLKAAAGITELSDGDIPVYDADNSNSVNTSDAVYILRYVSGMIDKM